MPTWTPWFASESVMPRPMPREPPVTKACLAVSVIVCIPLDYDVWPSRLLVAIGASPVGSNRPGARVFKGVSIRSQEVFKGCMSREPGQWYEFGPYRLDVGLSRLERSGTVVPISPKAFDLLLLLARSPERVLSKNELMEALWPNTFVEDANLTQHVYTLRKAVGDRPDGHPYIETVPRRGYRLNADVRIRDRKSVV